MRTKFTSINLVVAGCLAFYCATSVTLGAATSGAAPGQDQLYYHYFKERRPLKLDTERVAILQARPAAESSATSAPAKTSQAIPWSQLGAKAGGDYQGDGLAIMPAAEGARLRCVFQRLEGEATREGLWLTSTVTNGVNDRFRVTAAEVGRVTPCAPGAANKTSNIQHPTSNWRQSATSPLTARPSVSSGPV
jgi:hypothetical protein